MSKASKAIKEAFDLGETELALNGISKLIEGSVKTFGQVADFATESVDSILEIGEKISKGDIGGAVAQAADLTTKIGEALLLAPPPINIAGGIILGIGILSKIAAKIISAVTGRQKTQVELAQENLDKLNLQTEAYQNQLQLVETLQNLGSGLVDTAEERLQILRDQKDELDKQREIIEENRIFSDQEVLARQKQLNDQRVALDEQRDAINERKDLTDEEKKTQTDLLTAQIKGFSDQIAALSLIRKNNEVITRKRAIELGLLEDLSELTDKELADRQLALTLQQGTLTAAKDSLESAKELGQEERKRIVRAAGFKVPKFVTDAALDKMIADVQIRLNNTEFDLASVETDIEFNIQEAADIQQAFEDTISELDFRIDAALDTGKIDLALGFLEERVDMFRTKAEDAFTGLGIDISGVTFETADDVKEFINTLGDIKIPIDVQEAINNFIDSLEKSEEIQEDIAESGFRDQIELIRAREAAEKITTAEADEQVLALLEDQLQLLIDTNAEELDILKIEAEILDLKRKQNDENEQSNEALVKAVRERQKLLDIIRQETAGGTLTAMQRQRLDTSQQKIVSELRASGASEEEVQAFLRTLPAFSEGGVVSKTGLALVEAGEPIIPVNRVEEIQAQLDLFANMLSNNNPIFSGNDDLTLAASRIILQKEAQNINQNMNFGINDIIINMNIPPTMQNPKQVADLVKSEIENTILNTVQKGFAQNKIDVRGVKI
jgi:hypothetical protein